MLSIPYALVHSLSWQKYLLTCVMGNVMQFLNFFHKDSKKPLFTSWKQHQVYTAKFRVQHKVVDKIIKQEGRIVAIHNYGFGGGNAHIILKFNSMPKIVTLDIGIPRIELVSGLTEEAA